jgi:hypothetical protein
MVLLFFIVDTVASNLAAALEDGRQQRGSRVALTPNAEIALAGRDVPSRALPSPNFWPETGSLTETHCGRARDPGPRYFFSETMNIDTWHPRGKNAVALGRKFESSRDRHAFLAFPVT